MRPNAKTLDTARCEKQMSLNGHDMYQRHLKKFTQVEIQTERHLKQFTQVEIQTEGHSK